MKNDKEFNEIIKNIINDKQVLEMKKYRQHFNTTCFDHCYDVAYECYKISKKLNLDYVSATRGAMLHDLFLYDWRNKEGRNNIHAFTHGKIACKNALKSFELNDKEKDMIIKHMWPVTLIPPKSCEGIILTIADKYCAVKEWINYFFNKKKLLSK